MTAGVAALPDILEGHAPRADLEAWGARRQTWGSASPAQLPDDFDVAVDELISDPV